MELKELLDDETLRHHLKEIFLSYDSSLKGLNIISREIAPRSGTFQAEIVKCSFDNSPDKTVRCKYLQGHENNQEGGHRGGVTYEVKVYESLLRDLPFSVVPYIGSFKIIGGNCFCMVLEYLPDSIKVNKAKDKFSMEKAAAWIGAFHSAFEAERPAFVTVYDEDYYKHWEKNLRNIAQELKDEYPWMIDLCDYFLDNIHQLLSGPQTVIHGEYYPNNVLYKDGLVYPIDWESAAFAPGEIDLASITEGYEEHRVESMMKSYAAARWPGQDVDVEGDLMKRFYIARLYFSFRWIGRYPSMEIWKKRPDKLEKCLKSIGKLHTLSLAMNCV